LSKVKKLKPESTKTSMKRGIFRRKSYTKYRILGLLRENKMTVSEIAESLGLSRSTVYTLLQLYRRQYIVRQGGLKMGESGRKSRVWYLTRRGVREIEKLRDIYGFV